jgi:hypothetical protein
METRCGTPRNGHAECDGVLGSYQLGPPAVPRVVAERTVTPPAALPIKGGMRFLGIDFRLALPGLSVHFECGDVDIATRAVAAAGH